MDQKSFESINSRLPGNMKLAIVPIDQLELLQKNARYMKHETFQKLVNNIKRDGGLSSVPFCYLTEEGKYRVLSGNHRVMAAREAGLTEILILYRDTPMSREEQVAVQLSHNAIEGQDDPVILRELYREIEDLALKYYSGLDDKILGELEKVQLAGLSEASLEYLTLTFLFLPEEVERLKEVLAKAIQATHSDTILARYKEYDRILDAQAKVKGAYNIHNGATAMMIILDVFERHLEDLRDGWLDQTTGETLHDGWVPIASIIGTDLIPANAAAVIHKAVERMVSNGEVTQKNKWQALEYMAAEYLAG